MTRCPRNLFHGILTVGLAVVLGAVPLPAGEVTAQDLETLLSQNRKLQKQVEQQQQQIEALRQRVEAMESKPADPGRERDPAEEITRRRVPPEAVPVIRAAHEIRLSGEAGLAFFSSGHDGAFPNSEFRVDDAKIFVEAPIWNNVYFYTGLEMTTREAADEYFHVGELYVDAEDVLKTGNDYSLSLRAGRFFIPFGEEYQCRNVMDNPLIMHSEADIWGVDEGVQAYGTLGRLQYNLAVQNGGHKTLHDYNKDKSVTFRIGFDPLKSLHLSASAHRTGKLDAVNDTLSEIWFSNGFFRALGSAATTRTFAANLYELDAIWHWKEGRFAAAAGRAYFDDDSTQADNSRRFTFYSLEAVQQLMGRLYGAARFSRLSAPAGYPLVGLGNAGAYFYRPLAPRTTDLERFSAGLGYRFDLPLVWKLEYSWETGHETGGGSRGNADTLSSEVGLKF